MRRMAMTAVVMMLLVAAACASDSSEDALARVGFVRPVAAGVGQPAFDAELEASGFIAGDNLVYVQDDPDGEILLTPDDVRSAVEEWVAGGIDLIVAFSSSGATVAAETAPETPVLFLVNDPVAVGLVTNEARPDRNLTGVTFRVPADRTLDLARQAIPDLDRIGILVPATDPAGPPSRDSMLAAAATMQIESAVEDFTDESDIARAVTALSAQSVDAIVVVNSPTSIRFFPVIEPAATALGLPTIANTSIAVRALVALEPDIAVLLEQLGRQAARLLSGVPPADIPVEDPTIFRVVLNAAMAAELGLPEFPADLVRQADHVTG